MLTFQDAQETRLGVLEGIALLVRHGWSERFVLYEMPLDVFKDLIIVVKKHDTIIQKTAGLTIMAAVGALLSKEGGKTIGLIDDVVEQYERLLRDGSDPAKYQLVSDDNTPGKPAKKPKDQARFMQMLGRFHSNFGRLTGGRMPSLQSAIERAAVSQQNELKLKE